MNRMPDATEQLVTSIVRTAVLECIAGNGAGQLVPPDLDPETFFNSPTAGAIKEEIIRAGKKLWQREYVDGNGGNISARIFDEYVICTPTLCSKADMRAEDLSLVDLNNCQICGDRAHTS